MKRCTLFAFLVSLLLLSTEASGQLERFVGTWEIRKSPTAGRVNLTVNIVQAGDTINGTVTFLNPDGTTTQWPIAKPEFKGTPLTKSLISHTDFNGPHLIFKRETTMRSRIGLSRLPTRVEAFFAETSMSC